jgi:hypothetical protein
VLFSPVFAKLQPSRTRYIFPILSFISDPPARNSFPCHTSVNSPLSPAVATDGKTPSCKSFPRHTYDTPGGRYPRHSTLYSPNVQTCQCSITLPSSSAFPLCTGQLAKGSRELGRHSYYCIKSFICNTYEPPRKCCKQKTYSHTKLFRCNTYKKHGGGGIFPTLELCLLANPANTSHSSFSRDTDQDSGLTRYKSRSTPLTRPSICLSQQEC